MMKNQNPVIETPIELAEVMATSEKARIFYESLAPSYKKGYDEWVGGAKQEKTRKDRASKALLMLEAEKKTLTTKL
jgi:uncharacterized protein YdeI (YjbR/CyaY-like superfamily)